MKLLGHDLSFVSSGVGLQIQWCSVCGALRIQKRNVYAVRFGPLISQVEWWAPSKDGFQIVLKDYFCPILRENVSSTIDNF